jgi:hypothetical protein
MKFSVLSFFMLDGDGRGVWIGPTRRESIMGDIDKKMGCVKATAGWKMDTHISRAKRWKLGKGSSGF